MDRHGSRWIRCLKALVVLTGTPATTIMQAGSKGAACFFFSGVRAKKAPRKNSQRFVGAAFGGGVVTLCQIFTIDGHANQIAPATVAMPMRFATW